MRSTIVLFVFQMVINLGCLAQRQDSVSIHMYGRIKKPTYAPLSLLTGGILANLDSEEAVKNELTEEDNGHWGHFSTGLDNYLQFSPIAVTYGFDAFGVCSKTDWLSGLRSC